jgi:hypothetical protein
MSTVCNFCCGQHYIRKTVTTSTQRNYLVKTHKEHKLFGNNFCEHEYIQ